MKRKKYRNLIIPILAASLFILLPILALLQYNWIGELSEREKEHLRNTIENSSMQFAFEFNREIMQLQKNFIIKDTIINFESIIQSMQFNLIDWRKNEKSAILDSMFIVKVNDSINCYYINEKTNEYIKTALPVFKGISKNNIISIIEEYKSFMPCVILGYNELLFNVIEDNSEIKYIVLMKLNPQMIKELIITKTIEVYFPSYTNYTILLNIIAANNEIIYTNSNDSIPNRNYEYKTVFGMIPPFHLHKKYQDKFFKKMQPPPKMEDTPIPKNEKPRFNIRNDERFIKDLPANAKPPYLYVGFKSGTLEQHINFLRYRNLIISFSILIILAIVVLLIIYISTKTKMLANQQMNFVAGISHELRTPLTVIRTASQNLADGVVNNFDKTKNYGNLILKETNKLWDMIETTLMYAGIQTNKQIIRNEMLLINPIIQKAIDNTSVFTNKHNIIFNHNENLENIFIFGDENSLIIAFQNIILNAAKFNKDNGSIIITTYLSNDNKYISVSIKDEGIGISAKEIPHIFEPFYRSKNAVESNIHGNGIGLSIVKKIIDLHKGIIKVDSTLNSGTNFIILLMVKNEN